MNKTIKCNCEHQPVLCVVNTTSGTITVKKRGFIVESYPPANITCGDCEKQWRYVDGQLVSVS